MSGHGPVKMLDDDKYDGTGCEPGRQEPGKYRRFPAIVRSLEEMRVNLRVLVDLHFLFL